MILCVTTQTRCRTLPTSITALHWTLGGNTSSIAMRYDHFPRLLQEVYLARRQAAPFICATCRRAVIQAPIYASRTPQRTFVTSPSRLQDPSSTSQQQRSQPGTNAQAPQTHYDFFPSTFPSGQPPNSPFTPDLKQLKKEYIQLQAKSHPDHAPAGQERHAEALSMRINEAYRTLSDPLKRAQYLLSLRGIDVEDESAKMSGGPLLMEVMEAREAVDEVEDEEGLTEIKAENDGRIAQSVGVLDEAFAREDVERAAEEAIRLRSTVDRARDCVFGYRGAAELHTNFSLVSTPQHAAASSACGLAYNQAGPRPYPVERAIHIQRAIREHRERYVNIISNERIKFRSNAASFFVKRERNERADNQKTLLQTLLLIDAIHRPTRGFKRGRRPITLLATGALEESADLGGPIVFVDFARVLLLGGPMRHRGLPIGAHFLDALLVVLLSVVVLADATHALPEGEVLGVDGDAVVLVFAAVADVGPAALLLLQVETRGIREEDVGDEGAGQTEPGDDQESGRDVDVVVEDSGE
ncbi:hypothetical protein KC322_g21 [Hortaea werneckii]|nr:hypothetical protein KC322_g21 [Hortaea werneckii]